MKKILVEFFDRENLNNCISQLHEPFDKILYLYQKSDRSPENEILFSSLREFNKTRAGIDPEFIEVAANNIADMVGVLSQVVTTEDNFIFDITGGPELFIMATGLFVGSYPSLHIRIQQYDVVTGRMIASYPGDVSANQKEYTLSVKEIIRLHGSAIVDGTFRYDIDKNDLKNNIIRLWNAVKKSKSAWNRFCTLPNFRESISGGTMFFKRTSDKYETGTFREIASLLEQKNLITVMSQRNVNGVTYSSFISRMPQNADMLFEKGGNLLEMLTYAAVREADARADVLVGVPVDWDGVITGESGETRNEIDVIASNGKIPIFISCKNTDVTNEFLYELKAMGKHYGGRYAKCILVSTSSNSVSIHKRAKAMDIELIDNMVLTKTEDFFARIKKACK